MGFRPMWSRHSVEAGNITVRFRGIPHILWKGQNMNFRNEIILSIVKLIMNSVELLADDDKRMEVDVSINDDELETKYEIIFYDNDKTWCVTTWANNYRSYLSIFTLSNDEWERLTEGYYRFKEPCEEYELDETEQDLGLVISRLNNFLRGRYGTARNAAMASLRDLMSFLKKANDNE